MSNCGTIDSSTSQRVSWKRLKPLAFFAGALVLCFAVPLWRLLRFCLHDELFSYIPLIPCISLYLISLKKETLGTEGKPPRSWAVLPAVAGVATLTMYWAANHSGWRLGPEETMSVTTLAFVLFFWAGCLFLLPGSMLRQIIFPIGFLILIVPIPPFFVASIDDFFQHTSAATAQSFFELARTPVLREGLELHLADITLKVAPECSGIHSTVVLFITSLLAGYLFLPETWKRIVMVLVIVPLAFLRNGFRVFVIGELCVHYGPQMIDSPIHRKGGPLFFALSLIPFFLFLLILRRVGPRKQTIVLQPQTSPL